MSLYAVCTSCNSTTRLTERLAIDIARNPGPPASICCHSEMKILHGEEVLAADGKTLIVDTRAYMPIRPIERRDRHDHGLKPPPAANP